MRTRSVKAHECIRMTEPTKFSSSSAIAERSPVSEQVGLIYVKKERSLHEDKETLVGSEPVS